MHLTVKVDLIGRSRMVLELSPLVGLNFRFVIGHLLELTMAFYNESCLELWSLDCKLFYPNYVLGMNELMIFSQKID